MEDRKETPNHEAIALENVTDEGRDDGYEDAGWDEHDKKPFLFPDILSQRALERAYDGIDEGWLSEKHSQLYCDAFIASYQKYVAEIQEIEAYGGTEKLKQDAFTHGYALAQWHHHHNKRDDDPFMPADVLEREAFESLLVETSAKNNTLMWMLYTTEYIRGYRQYRAEVQKKEEENSPKREECPE